jgi:hypothetical protein
MKHFLSFAIGFCALSIGSSFAHAITLTCDNGVVEMSDSKYEIIHKCGEATFIDFSKVTRVSKRSDEVVQKFVTVEDWLYNFGRHRFVILFTFENDKLIGLRRLGYGRSDGDNPDFNKKVKIGDPTVRLLFLYGPPSYKEERVETSVVSRKDGITLPRQTTVATWTYNLGPNRFMRMYHFVNGRLRRIVMGELGF